MLQITVKHCSEVELVGCGVSNTAGMEKEVRQIPAQNSVDIIDRDSREVID